jgi:hypothetical protein
MTPGTPEARAAEWILYEDAMQLPLDAPNLQQRCVLALLYFSTTDNGRRPWSQCSPEANGTSCIYINGEMRFPAERWLGNSSECLWAGVACTISETVGQLILAQQGITGALPTAFGLLPDLTDLSVEGNQFSGTST